ALLHQLPCPHNVGPGLEDEGDRREPRNRLGAHVVELGGAAERVLQLDSDQGFHLGGGHAWGFSLNLHQWRGELGKDVHRHVAKLAEANEHHGCGERHHQEAKMQARSDDPTHHGWRPPSNSVPYNSGTPTVTTAVPEGGLCESMTWSPS